MRPTIAARIRAKMPATWAAALTEGAPTTLGYDVATTDKATSNPGAVAVMQQIGRDRLVRLLIRWKAAEDHISHAVLDMILDDLDAAGVRPRALGIDSTSEKYFATATRRRLAGRVPVVLCSFSENVEIDGEKMSMKVAGCSAYVGRFEDNALALPNAEWVYADHRLVKAQRGTYIFEEDSVGNHADAFAACMLADYVMSGQTGTARVAVADGRPPGRDDDGDGRRLYSGPQNELNF